MRVTTHPRYVDLLRRDTFAPFKDESCFDTG